MQALELLCNRTSVALLAEPAPTPEQREQLFRAALRAPDHGQLRPWRFLTIEGDARAQLGEIFVRVQQQENPNAHPDAFNKTRQMPLRAPLLVVVIARLTAVHKVPESEQLLAAGCAAHGILLAAHAQGLGAIWRTGELSHSAAVRQALGLAASERIVGFIYMGTPQTAPHAINPLKIEDFVEAWSGV